jgi:hypothetical protein
MKEVLLNSIKTVFDILELQRRQMMSVIHQSDCRIGHFGEVT